MTSDAPMLRPDTLVYESDGTNPVRFADLWAQERKIVDFDERLGVYVVYYPF